MGVVRNNHLPRRDLNMWKKITLIIIGLSLIISSTTYAFTLQQYIDYPKNDETMEMLDIYFTALGKGVSSMHNLAVFRDYRTPFCIPYKVRLDAAMVKELIDQELNENYATWMEISKACSIEAIFIRSLVVHFPCTK